MGYLFSGSVELTADDKNRFRFPAKYKDAYLSYDASNELVIEDVYVLKMPHTNFLTVMPKKVAESIIRQMQKLLYINETRDTIIAKYCISHIEPCKVDSQGRFVISQRQKGSLILDKEIVMVGMGNQIEIWDKKVYEASMASAEEELSASFDESQERSIIDNMVIGIE